MLRYLFVCIFFMIVGCNSFTTPTLPQFSDDTLSYDDVLIKRRILAEKIKNIRAN